MEDDSYIQNNIVFTYHNVDVNCDGDENDYITGLNTKSWYTNIDYACIISDWLGNGSDGVVTTYSQDLTNFNGLPKLEKFDASSYGHTDLPSADYINFKSLDEPDYKELAYEIDFGSLILAILHIKVIM